MEFKTYKHRWTLDKSNGSVKIRERSFYPLAWLGWLTNLLEKKFRVNFRKDNRIVKDSGEQYDYFTNPEDINIQSERADIFAEILNKENFNISDKSLLDISGGNGVFAKRFLKHGAGSVAITEFNKDSVEYTKNNLGIPAFYFDLNNHKISDLIDKKFDVIMLRGCIEFCNDLSALTKDLKKISHKNTIVIVTFIVPTLGAALRTQFDQYNVLKLRQIDTVENIFSSNEWEVKSNTEMFLFSRNYAFDHLTSSLNWFYLLYAFFILRKLNKNHNPFEFHALDCKCQLMLFGIKN